MEYRTKIPYKEWELADQMVWDYLGGILLRDPVWGPPIREAAETTLRMEADYVYKSEKVAATGKDPYRNKEVALLDIRYRSAREITQRVMKYWITLNTGSSEELFRASDINTAHWLYSGVRNVLRAERP